MPALLLYEFPAAAAEAQSRILDKVALLAVRGEAAIKFRAIEDAGCGRPERAVLTVEIPTADVARTLREECRTDAALPTSLKMRILHLATTAAGLPTVALFP